MFWVKAVAAMSRDKPLAVIFDDADRIQTLPLDVVSALRSVLQSSDGVISPIFIVTPGKLCDEMFNDYAQPFYGYSTILKLRSKPLRACP